MADEPQTPQDAPYVVNLEPGTYKWCSCGKSKKQPFCDDSHQGTSFSPVTFSTTERKMVMLCGCKHTKNPPYCDGNEKRDR
jgi:CDGSH-type Zn-finger protein